MRILQCGMGWFEEQPGGLNRMFLNLARHLPATGVDVTALVCAGPVPSDGYPFAVHRFSRPAAWLGARLLAARRAGSQLVRTGSFDLVASHFALYTYSMLDRLRPSPLVVHFHGPWADEASQEGQRNFTYSIKKHIEDRVYAAGTRFVVLSEAFKHVLVTKYGADEEQVRIIPGGVDADSFDVAMTRQECRALLGWPEERPAFLAVRRLARRMGIENLISAAKIVAQKFPDVLIVVAGRGPLQLELTARIAELGVQHNVRLIGFVEDELLPAVYRAADWTVVPTVALEGFGLVTIESLAAGTPVLVTPVGGLPEVVRPFNDNHVLEGSDVESLASGMMDALAGALPRPDGATCTHYARKHFDWPVIARRTRGVYEEALR